MDYGCVCMKNTHIYTYIYITYFTYMCVYIFYLYHIIRNTTETGSGLVVAYGSGDIVTRTAYH